MQPQKLSSYDLFSHQQLFLKDMRCCLEYAIYVRKEFEVPTLHSRFFEILTFVFLSEVAYISFCVKFSGLKNI